jgi:hypothetical protein
VKMSGALMLLECLKREGVDLIFGLPGGAVLPIYDVLYDFEGIRHILVRQEAAAGHAAEGYSRTTGRTGVCLVLVMPDFESEAIAFSTPAGISGLRSRGVLKAVRSSWLRRSGSRFVRLWWNSSRSTRKRPNATLGFVRRTVFRPPMPSTCYS